MTHVQQHGSGASGSVASGSVDDGVRDILQECIEQCFNCHATCTTTVQHCLAAGGALADQSVVGVLIDCAEMAQVSASFMLRGSAYHMVTAAACAELCRTAEEACRPHSGDERLLRCAEVCAACAECCEQIEELATV